MNSCTGPVLMPLNAAWVCRPSWDCAGEGLRSGSGFIRLAATLTLRGHGCSHSAPAVPSIGAHHPRLRGFCSGSNAGTRAPGSYPALRSWLPELRPLLRAPGGRFPGHRGACQASVPVAACSTSHTSQHRRRCNHLEPPSCVSTSLIPLSSQPSSENVSFLLCLSCSRPQVPACLPSIQSWRPEGSQSPRRGAPRTGSWSLGCLPFPCSG
uniref:Uncharacterized protein n=1 Tax=Myotis myotis TaxID=51298 RepID=A0A7J7TTM7_MYOMY|nr:hypothetical protein mMyoMyo1_008928 [Myotis myotis]